MAKTGVRGISFDVRDKLYDAGFQYRGLRFRKKFKTLELARAWMEETKRKVQQDEMEERRVEPILTFN